MPLRALVAGALAVLAAVPATGVAAPPPGPVAAASAPARTTTTISWTGARGIRLQVPRTAVLDGADAGLVVRGGSYAFVRMLGKPNPGCEESIGKYCEAMQFSYVRSMVPGRADGSSTSAPWTIVPDPANLLPPVVDVYLFTDGAATLTLRLRNLTGSAAYRPTGRVQGLVKRLSRACAPTSCADAPMGNNSVSFGGAAFDLGPRGGWAEAIGTASASGATDATGNGLYGLQGCLFPNPAGRSLSPDPADHPYGCGLAPDDDSQGYPTVAGEVNGRPHYGSSYGMVLWWTEAKGRQYVGYRAKSAGTRAADVDVYGIWFRLGIT